MIVLLVQMTKLFLLMIMGYLANKMNYLDSIANEKISKLIVNVTIPFLIISAAIGQEAGNTSKFLLVIIIAVVSYILIPFISQMVVKWLRWENEYQLMLNYSNLGFMGIPIISSLYGTEAVIYVSLFMMVSNISIFSTGIKILQKNNGERLKLKKLLNPGIIGAFIGLAILLFQIPVNEQLAALCSSVGSITTPLAMLIMGSILAEIKLGSVFSDKKLYLMCLIRLIVYPLGVMFILSLITSKSIISGVATILWGLPVAGNISMLCMEYSGDTELVTKGVCMSTLFSLVSIPLLSIIILH